MSVDLVFMTSEEYEHKSLRTINNVAVYAREEGIKMTRDSDGCDDLPDDNALCDPTHENGERNRRIADANMHYNSTCTVLLDMPAMRVQQHRLTMRTRRLSTVSRHSYRPWASGIPIFTV